MKESQIIPISQAVAYASHNLYEYIGNRTKTLTFLREDHLQSFLLPIIAVFSELLVLEGL